MELKWKARIIIKSYITDYNFLIISSNNIYYKHCVYKYQKGVDKLYFLIIEIYSVILTQMLSLW